MIFMLVRDVMNKKVVTVEPGVTVKEAAKIMTRCGIGSLLVVDKNKKVVGVVTNGNVLETIAKGKDADLVTLEEVMSKKVVSVEPDKTIEHAVNLMVENKIKKLPVVDGNRLVGIVTASDIIVVEPKLIEEIAKLISINLVTCRGG